VSGCGSRSSNFIGFYDDGVEFAHPRIANIAQIAACRNRPAINRRAEKQHRLKPVLLCESPMDWALFHSPQIYLRAFSAEKFGLNLAQLKAKNSTESDRESNSRSKDTKPRKRGCFQPDD
jgi:hypothetical protein